MGTQMGGLDGLSQDKLEEIRQNTSKLSEMKQEVPVEELFADSFMARHTRFSNIEELLKAAGFDGTTDEDFDRFIQGNGIDSFIAEHTSFSSWSQFQEKAVAAYISALLGLE